MVPPGSGGDENVGCSAIGQAPSKAGALSRFVGGHPSRVCIPVGSSNSGWRVRAMRVLANRSRQVMRDVSSTRPHALIFEKYGVVWTVRGSVRACMRHVTCVMLMNRRGAAEGSSGSATGHGTYDASGRAAYAVGPCPRASGVAIVWQFLYANSLNPWRRLRLCRAALRASNRQGGAACSGGFLH